MKRILVALLLWAGLAPAAEPLDVLVTILPHASLVERLGGNHVRVHVLVGPGESPATYDPTPRELARLAPARLWFTTGAPLEAALTPRLALLQPNLEVVATHATLALIDTAPHHDDHGHDHGETDPHVWLSPRNTIIQAGVMADALTRALPALADTIAASLADLTDELRTIDRDLQAMLAPVRGHTVFVFHPAFGYFTHDYGLRQAAVESGGLAPSPRHLTNLLADIRRKGARTVFVQPQHSDRTVRVIAAEAGLAVVELDPLARDHLANLRILGATILAGLEARP